MVHTSLAQERKQRRETLHEILHFSEDLWSAVIHKQLHEDHGKRQHLHRILKWRREVVLLHIRLVN